MMNVLRLLTVLATLALAACGTLAPTPTPEPLSPDNIRQRIVQSLEREGHVAQFEIWFTDQGAQEPTLLINGWVDMANERGRIDEPGGSTAVVSGGRAFNLHASSRSTSLTESAIRKLAPDVGVNRSPSVDNTALGMLNPLILPLAAPGTWIAAGLGEWNGEAALLWEKDHSLGEDNGDMHSTVFVDPQTALPTGQIFGPRGVSRSAQRSNRFSYEFTFVSNGDVPVGTFATENMRERLLGYGAHEGEGPDYRLAWLGPDSKPGGGLPGLTLQRSQVSGPSGIPFTTFTYYPVSPSPLPSGDQRGSVNITVRPTPAWEDWAVDREETWYEYLPREEVTVLGEPALFIVESATRARAIVLLDDITIELETAGLHDPIPAERYEGAIAPSPTYDRNAFNDAEAIRALLPLLTEVR